MTTDLMERCPDKSHSDHCCGHHQQVVYSVHQTLDEMDFERGIWSAALNGEIERVEKFIRDGVDVNSFDTSGYTALHYAARNGHNSVCQLLLSNGACSNSQTRSGRVCALHRAAYCGHLHVVKTLLSAKARADLEDSDGQLPLHKAAERDHPEIGQVLMGHFPESTEVKDRRGRRPCDCLPVNHSEKWEMIFR